jgi:hypothetical protein
MPTYPGSPQITVDSLLRNPAIIARNLTALASKRFVADKIFTRGTPEQVAGGAMTFQRAENIYPDRSAEEVGIRSEWPRTGWSEAILQAAVKQYGLETPIAYLAIRRNQLDQVARAERKLANAVTKFVDAAAMTAITTDAAVNTGAAAAAWSAGATTIISDLATMRKTIADQDEGYAMDTLVLNPAQELFLFTNSDLRGALPREGTNNLLNGGRAVPILGIEQILVTPQLTAGTVLGGMAKVVGTIADERPDGGEGYVSFDVNAQAGASGGVATANASPGGINIAGRTVDPNAAYPADFAPVYVKVYNNDGVDDRIVRGARWPAMAILEPKSFYKLTAA